MERNEDLLIADKLLFAVDLVDYIIIKTRPNFGYKTLSILEKVDRLRNLTHNHFAKTIRKALCVIDINQDHSVYKDFEKMMDDQKVNKESFMEYAKKHREHHSPDEFDAKSFLKYCDRVANMAGYFLSYGVDNASEVAVELIMQAFPSVMLHETWKKLTNVAQTLVVLGSDYYRRDVSSESSSEAVDLISSENDESSSDSLNMDVNVSSPEDTFNRDLDIASVILRKKHDHASASNGSPRSNVISMPKSFFELRELLNNQSSNSAGSSALSSYSSNDRGPEEVEMLNNSS